MKQTTRSLASLGVLAVGLALLLPAGDAQADWRILRPRTHRHHLGETVLVLPWGSRRVVASGESCYYRRGVFYRRDPHRGYVVITAPVGVTVPDLPEGDRTIVVDGVTYHEYDGVYYKGGPSGYTVVPIAQAPAAVPADSAATQTTMVVNVPNKNGSYTPVTLQAAGNGTYLGPQGEVYPTQPTLAQLQAMYGK